MSTVPCLGIEGDELAAADGGEVGHAVGHRDARGDEVADVGVHRLARRAAHGAAILGRSCRQRSVLRVEAEGAVTRPPVGGTPLSAMRARCDRAAGRRCRW